MLRVLLCLVFALALAVPESLAQSNWVWNQQGGYYQRTVPAVMVPTAVRQAVEYRPVTMYQPVTQYRPVAGYQAVPVTQYQLTPVPVTSLPLPQMQRQQYGYSYQVPSRPPVITENRSFYQRPMFNSYQPYQSGIGSDCPT